MSKKQKFPVYRGMTAGGFEVQGFYVRHIPVQPFPFGEDRGEVKHYIAMDEWADWGMPRRCALYEVDFSSITLVDKIE